MIHFYDVNLSYDKRKTLKDISFSISKGEFVYLTGASGSGKSTLLKLIYMDILPDSGSFSVAEYDSLSIKKRHLPYLRRKVGVVFQDFKLLPDRTVFENIAFVLKVTGTRRNQINRKVEKVLSEVGLSGKGNRFPHEISGGEQQRVAIARAIVNEPFVLVADEPTGNLDPDVEMEILELLIKINRRGTAILMATHNYELISRYPQRQLRIENGNLIEV